jgi:hypothetical protein
MPQIDYQNQLYGYYILFLGLTSASVLRSLRDQWTTVARRTGFARLGTNRAGEALARRGRHNPPYGVVQRTNRLAYLHTLPSPAGVGKSRNPVS